MTAALLIAAAGALLIVLVMVAVPSVRRGAGLLSTGAVAAPQPSPFRATATTGAPTIPAPRTTGVTSAEPTTAPEAVALEIATPVTPHGPPRVRDIEVPRIELVPHRAPVPADEHEHALPPTGGAPAPSTVPVALGSDLGVRADGGPAVGLRDPAVAVSIAAVVIVGVTVLALRRSRRR